MKEVLCEGGGDTRKTQHSPNSKRCYSTQSSRHLLAAGTVQGVMFTLGLGPWEVHGEVKSQTR